MRNISSTTRPINYGETSWETGSISDSYERESIKNLIQKANSVPILKIFQIYNIKIDEVNRKIVCPFKSHKNGRESTPSFYYYPNTNTYWCYGCKQGSHPTDFVMHMDEINVYKAANKIIKILSSEISLDNLDSGLEKDSFFESLKIMIKFSNCVRDFRNNYSDNNSFLYIENICKTYDDITQKHSLNNIALETVIDQLVDKINNYKI